MRESVFETLVGALVVGVACIFLWFAYDRGGEAQVSGSQYEVSARFNNVSGISRGSDVRIAGVKAGIVKSIEGDPKRALSDLRTLFGNLNTDVSSYLNRLEEQIVSAQTALRDADGDQNAVRFDTKFGRNLEYYSGFIFEISDKDHPELRQIAGGGRYDRLMTGLGSPREIPATGCAIYVDRLLAATGAQS